jgi:polysaccharide biosynthesis protein VpsQ
MKKSKSHLERKPLPRVVVATLLGGLATASVAGFSLIVLAADRGTLPVGLRRLYDWPGGDKVGHVVLLAMVTFAVALALRGRTWRIGRWSLPVASVVVAVGITLEEASQAWFPGRTLSLADLACSYIGIAIGSWGAAALAARVGVQHAPKVPRARTTDG